MNTWLRTTSIWWSAESDTWSTPASPPKFFLPSGVPSNACSRFTPPEWRLWAGKAPMSFTLPLLHAHVLGGMTWLYMPHSGWPSNQYAPAGMPVFAVFDGDGIIAMH